MDSHCCAATCGLRPPGPVRQAAPHASVPASPSHLEPPGRFHQPWPLCPRGSHGDRPASPAMTSVPILMSRMINNRLLVPTQQVEDPRTMCPCAPTCGVPGSRARVWGPGFLAVGHSVPPAPEPYARSGHWRARPRQGRWSSPAGAAPSRRSTAASCRPRPSPKRACRHRRCSSAPTAARPSLPTPGQHTSPPAPPAHRPTAPHPSSLHHARPQQTTGTGRTGRTGRLTLTQRQPPAHRPPPPSPVVLSPDQRHTRGKVTHSAHTLTYDTGISTRPTTRHRRMTHHYGSPRIPKETREPRRTAWSGSSTSLGRHLSRGYSGSRMPSSCIAREGGPPSERSVL